MLNSRSGFLATILFLGAAGLTPCMVAGQGVQIRAVEQSTVHGWLADTLGVADGASGGDGEADTLSFAVHGDRLRREGERGWLVDMGTDRMTRRPWMQTYSWRPLRDLVSNDSTYMFLLGWAWSAEATGEEGEVAGLPSRRVHVTSNVREWDIFPSPWVVFADVWVSDDRALEPLISFQRAHGHRLRKLSPALLFLGDLPLAFVEAVLTEVEGFPVKADVYVVLLDEGAEFRPDALERGSGAPGQELIETRSISLAGPVRTDIPASLFEPPPGAVDSDAPLISDTLKALIDSEGIDEAVRFFRDAAENRTWDFRFDFDEINAMAMRHEDRMRGVGLDAEIDMEEAEVALALRRLLVEALPYETEYHGRLASLGYHIGDEELLVRHYQRLLELDHRLDGVRERLVELGAEPDPAYGEPVHLPPAILERYEGEYVVGTRLWAYPTEHVPLEGTRWTMTAEDGALVVRREPATSRERADGYIPAPFRLVPISETQFFDPEADLLVNFVTGPDGSPTGIRIKPPRGTAIPPIGRRVGPPEN